MANEKIEDGAHITVHGRGTLRIPFGLETEDGTQQLDISGLPLVFEVDGAPISEPLMPDPDDALGQLIVVERAQIQTLGQTALPFAVIDESEKDADIYTVLWAGTIKLTGFKGNPDTKAGL